MGEGFHPDPLRRGFESVPLKIRPQRKIFFIIKKEGFSVPRHFSVKLLRYAIRSLDSEPLSALRLVGTFLWLLSLNQMPLMYRSRGNLRLELVPLVVYSLHS